LVRQGVPGPCLGTKKRSKLAFRGRLATLEQDESPDVELEPEDVPEDENDEISITPSHDTLTGNVLFIIILFIIIISLVLAIG